MNKIIMFVLLFPLSVSAVDFEIGTGTTNYKTAHDGLWYQEGYPHRLDLNSTPMSLGISHEYKGIRYRAEYIYLGFMHTAAVFTSDAGYYPGSDAKVTTVGHGKGNVGGLILSASRSVPIFGVPFYGEVGPFIYTPQWEIKVRDLTNPDDNTQTSLVTKSAVRLGLMLGFGVRYSGIDVSIKYLGMQYNQGEPFPPIYDRAYVLETKVYF